MIAKNIVICIFSNQFKSLIEFKNHREMEAKKVKSSYEILVTRKNVLINFPGLNDEGMKYITKHSFIDSKGKKVVVSSHFKKEDYYNRQLVVRNFFIAPYFRGQKIVVDEVKIIEKTDNHRKKITLIIDIILKGVGSSSLEPECKLSMGGPTGKFEIPGAPGKFIDFKSID